jgi:hypothetical protein
MVAQNNGHVNEAARRAKAGAGKRVTPDQNGVTAKPLKQPNTQAADEKASKLEMRIDDEARQVNPAQLEKDEFATELHDACEESDKRVIIYLDYLLEYADRERWLVLDFVAGLTHYRIAIGKARFDNLFDAVLMMMVGNEDMALFVRGRSAALEAALLLYPDALDGACARIVDRLRELGVKGIRAGDVLRDARQMQKALQRSRPVVEAPQRPVRELFPKAPIREAAVVPTGWRLSEKGISRASVDGDGPGIAAPVVLTERGRNSHKGVEVVTLAWLRDGRWQTAVVDRKIIADAHTVVELASAGLPVTSNNARTLVQYLDEFEAQNIQHLPVARVSHKMGWQGHDGEDGFLWGRNLITADGIYRADDKARGTRVQFRGADQGDDQLADGFRPAGTYKGWREGIQLLEDCPRALLGLYASFVPAMLPIFRSGNHVIDYAGQTTSGKTTMLRVVASVWGNPDERSEGAVVSTWNSTATWRERAPAVCCHLPLVLDDTKSLRFPDDVTKTIYAVVQGRGKGRGSVQGIATQDTCATLLFSSGEQAATAFTKDGGTRPRVLSFWGSPLGEVSPEMRRRVGELNRCVRDNYGHAGPRFIKCILGDRDNWPAWRHCYDTWLAGYEGEDWAGDNAIAGRMASHFAALTVTSHYVHQALELPWEWTNPVRPVFDELVGNSGDADVAANALNLAVDWAVAHRQHFYDRHAASSGQPQSGWVGRWDKDGTSAAWSWIGMFPHVLEKVLREGGFDFDATLRTWKERGWIEVDGDDGGRRRNTKRAQVGESLARVIAIRREAIDALHCDAGA